MEIGPTPILDSLRNGKVFTARVLERVEETIMERSHVPLVLEMKRVPLGFRSDERVNKND